MSGGVSGWLAFTEDRIRSKENESTPFYHHQDKLYRHSVSEAKGLASIHHTRQENCA